VRRHFQLEGYAANRVVHRGVVVVDDDDVTDDGAFFNVMELLKGIGVEDLRRSHRGRLPIPWAVNIVEQLLDVLSAVHAQGVVHRDIKPSNLFLLDDGTVKVLDFGIARIRDAAQASEHAGSLTGQLGTPGFMAPEQALGRTEEVDARTDVWSAGATLFTLLSGELAHVGRNRAELWVCSARDEARRLDAVAPEVPRELARVVQGGLANDRDDRWPTALAMLTELRRAYRETFGGETSPVGRDRWDVFVPHPPTTGTSSTESLESHRASHLDVAVDASRSASREATARPKNRRWPLFSTLGTMCAGTVVALAMLRPRGHGPGVMNSTFPQPVASVSVRLAIEAPPSTAAPAEPDPKPTPLPTLAYRHPVGSKLQTSPPKPPVSASAMAAVPPEAPPVPIDNCNPPYTLDDAGIRIPKAECTQQ
jgi:serine/threonine protein kinase